MPCAPRMANTRKNLQGHVPLPYKANGVYPLVGYNIQRRKIK